MIFHLFWQGNVNGWLYHFRKEHTAMKKSLCILLTVAMLAVVSSPAYAVTINTSTGSSGTEVKAKYNSNAPADVYSVDVTLSLIHI